MIVPSLVLVLGFPMRVAIATSLLIIGLISFGGIVGHLQVGTLAIPLHVLAFMIVGSASGMFIGTHIAKNFTSQTLTKLYAVIVIGLALSIIFDNFPVAIFS